MDTYPTYKATPSTVQCNTRHIVIYFDAEDEAHDGNGWCMVTGNGSVTGRFPTWAALNDFLTVDSFWQKYLQVNCVA